MASVEDRLVEDMRSKIIRGDLAAGSRLPNRQELRREFDVSFDTLQKGINQLVEDGFLNVGPRRLGTRVAQHPPHLHHYRLIFPYDSELKGTLWRALHDEAKRIDDAADSRRISSFYGLSGHRGHDEYQEVLDDVTCHRVAGLIFASSADELLDTPLITHPGIPRAAIANPGQLPGICKVAPDYDSFFEQAIAHLQERGRQRIAVLCSAPGMVEHKFRDAMEAAGLAMNPLWTLFASHLYPQGAESVLKLLLSPANVERPDGLILADDNFLTGACRGIEASGLTVPDELVVVALANFPCHTPTTLPIVRIGFDAARIMHTLIRRIDAQRQGRPTPEFEAIPAIKESDLIER